MLHGPPVLDINRQTYFEIFSMTESFDIDLEALGASYRKLQGQYHPDRVSGEGDGNRLQALQTSSIINQAFDTLKSPLKRAAYILSLKGLDPDAHEQSLMSEELLMQQMLWREELEEAAQDEDLQALDGLKKTAQGELQDCLSAFKTQLNEAQLHKAKALYHKLQFIDKMLQEINRAEEKILDY